jgi:hypothetical protein
MCIDFILLTDVLIRNRDDAETLVLVQIHSCVTVSFPSGVRPYTYGGREPDRSDYYVLGRLSQPTLRLDIFQKWIIVRGFWKVLVS